MGGKERRLLVDGRPVTVATTVQRPPSTTTRTYTVQIDTTARPEVTDAEVLRCLRERFPTVRVWNELIIPDDDEEFRAEREVTRVSAWKDE